GQEAVHERTSELGLRRVVRVAVDRVRVVRQQAEVDVVRLCDRAADRRAIDVTDLEVFEKAAARHAANASQRAPRCSRGRIRTSNLVITRSPKFPSDVDYLFAIAPGGLRRWAHSL